MTYKPTFICPYCEKEIPVAITSSETGMMGVCDCEEYRKEWERQHRLEIERRKRARGRRRG